MGLPFVIRFNKSDYSFYVCRTCQTHIASGIHFNYHYTPSSDTGVTGGLFDKVVNVQVDESAAHQKKVGVYTVADVHCITCGNHIGWKYVEVPMDDPAVTKSMVQLKMETLLRWDGNSLVNAHDDMEHRLELEPVYYSN